MRSRHKSLIHGAALRTILLRALAWSFLAITQIANAASLLPGQALYPGQGIYSDNGKYVLRMQGDGNLVYYRTADQGVRWASYTNGPNRITVMQDDGNLVVYDSAWSPLWHTHTGGRAGAYLAIQDDGNLVVYLGSQALWNIGADTEKTDPANAGDIVGRDLANVPIGGAAGHVGFYDGSTVYEVLNEPIVVQANTLQNFKSRVPANQYWGAGQPKIPNFYESGCYEADCTYTNAYSVTLSARMGMARRASQIRRIGARYTITANYSFALPREYSNPLRMGVYRCDTFVLDVYQNISGAVVNDLYGPNFQAYGRWDQFLDRFRIGAILPAYLFQQMKDYQG